MDSKTGSLIQTNVVSMLAYWMENYPSDFKEQLLSQVTDFIDAVSMIDLEASDAPPETQEIGEEQEKMYTNMCEKMIHEITMRDRKSKINIYQHVFTGLDLVMWVMKNVPGHKNIRKGVSFGVNAMELGLIDPVIRGSPFIPNKTNYYHFRVGRINFAASIIVCG